VERRHILQVLEQSRWVLSGSSGAAARLGIKRTTLINRLKKLGITRPAR
jgi:formate hydrogenlyase transcriptional activator